MSWSNAYIATPYVDQGRTAKGCDCWGLARLVYANELAISLPSYTEDYVSAEEQKELSQLIASERQTTWTRVKTPAPFDLLLFRHGRFETHIGIAVDAKRMLHIARGDQAKIEQHWDHARWARRYVGTFRHQDRLQELT